MLACMVIPLQVALERAYGFVKAAELVPLDNLPLHDAVKSLDVSVLFRGRNMGKFLQRLHFFEIPLNVVGNER